MQVTLKHLGARLREFRFVHPGWQCSERLWAHVATKASETDGLWKAVAAEHLTTEKNLAALAATLLPGDATGAHEWVKRERVGNLMSRPDRLWLVLVEVM